MSLLQLKSTSAEPAAPTDWDGAFTGDSAARGIPHMEVLLAAASAR